MKFFKVFTGTNTDDYVSNSNQNEYSTQTPDNPTSSTNHSYFEKKGEVNELKKLFKELMERAPV